MPKRKSSRKSSNSAGKGGLPPEDLYGRRELVVVAEAAANMRASFEGVASVAGVQLDSINKIVKRAKGKLTPLFRVAEEVLQVERSQMEASLLQELPDLSVYYQIDAADEQLDDLANELMGVDEVSAAYVKPAGESPVGPQDGEVDVAPAVPSSEPAGVTPSFEARQLYLNAAPVGIDARFAWTQPGGRGAGVNIIDLEWGWNFNHEDLRLIQGGVVAGTNSSRDDHGTAVIGEISGDQNAFGVTGICPDARISAVAFSMPTATAIRNAANRLRPGDIMLLEIHRAGPRFNFQGRRDQQGYIAVEWWPDDFDAIRYAISRGIIVVEAAGNGRQDLDDAIYSVRPNGFPQTWTNPFNRSNRDSGAIVVGAGAPPPGTHGRNHGADRSRLGFSNFGALIDAQGWGREVTSTGYADLQGSDSSGNPDPGQKDQWYTDTFSGTSSASPIVVGALGCVQGILRHRGTSPLTPATARQLLRSTGSPQQDTAGRPSTERIGNRPNLREMIARVTQSDVTRPTLRLLSLECKRTEDFFGADEAYLTLNGKRIWGPVSIRDGQTVALSQLDSVQFKRRIRLDLYDKDFGFFDRDDHLGTAYVWASQARSGEQQAAFQGEGALYVLTFEVTA